MKGNKQPMGLGWMVASKWREDGGGISLEIAIEPSVAVCRALYLHVQKPMLREFFEDVDVRQLAFVLLELSEVRPESVPVVVSALRQVSEAARCLVLQTDGQLVVVEDTVQLRFQESGASVWLELQEQLWLRLEREGFLLNKRQDPVLVLGCSRQHLAAEQFLLGELVGVSSMSSDLLLFERGSAGRELLAFYPLQKESEKTSR